MSASYFLTYDNELLALGNNMSAPTVRVAREFKLIFTHKFKKIYCFNTVSFYITFVLILFFCSNILKTVLFCLFTHVPPVEYLSLKLFLKT